MNGSALKANPAVSSALQRRPGARKGPLSGIRVTDFCWMGVGACATRLLADYGAQVIRIESRDRLDQPRTLPIYKGEARSYGQKDAKPDPNKGGLFNNYNRNKLGVTINIKSKRGRALAEQLISTSSVVTENFAPEVMEKWGFTYEHLKSLSPHVIYARMSGYGHSGPHFKYRSYGPTVQAVCGMSHISGLPGREPSGWGLSYMDNEAAFFNSAALLMAIYNRNITGQGAEIDVSAIEAGIGLLGPILLDVEVNQRSTRGDDYPLGNRLDYPNAAPHGVYPALGEDRWVAIAVFNDSEWRALVEEMGHPQWARDAKFATQDGRFAHQDELDAQIGAWTKDKDRHQLMHRLQARGVAAAAVQTAEDTNDHDPQIASRGLFFELDHPVIGEARFEGTPIKFSRTVQENWRSAPLLGEDNEYVFKELLGIKDDEYQDLVAEGIL